MAEMVPFNPLVGEFQFIAGFDPGRAPSRLPRLEVRSREVLFILEHGQVIGRLIGIRLTQPEVFYAKLPRSNYQRQGPAISILFKTKAVFFDCIISINRGVINFSRPTVSKKFYIVP